MLNYILAYPVFKKAFNWLTTNNISSSYPYHNLEHNLSVFNYSQKMSYFYDLSDIEKVTVGLASMFHDANYDSIYFEEKNIENALLFLDNFLDKNNDELIIKENIKKLILCTKYPYINEPENILEKIIRDSDRLSLFNRNWITHVIYGISAENCRKFAEQVLIQIKFINEISYYTDWAQQFLLRNKDKMISEYNKLLDIIKNQ